MSTDRTPEPAEPLVALAAAARALARNDDLDRVLAELLSILAHWSRVDRAAVVLLEEPPSRLIPTAALGVSLGELPALEIGPGEAGGIADVIARREPTTTTVGSGAAADVLAALGLTTASLVPLVVERAGMELVAGVLIAGRLDGTAVERSDLPLLGAIADLAAVAVERARTEASLTERSEWYERLAHLDPLTGLANRRTFDRVLELEIARAGRQAGDLSIAAFAVDDPAGSGADTPAADQALRVVGSALAESVRFVDTVARLDGGKFAVIAPGAGGVAVARRVLAAIAALAPIEGWQPSVSSGVAHFPTDGTTANALLEAATQALSSARAEGTGQIAEASPAHSGA